MAKHPTAILPMMLYRVTGVIFDVWLGWAGLGRGLFIEASSLRHASLKSSRSENNLRPTRMLPSVLFLFRKGPTFISPINIIAHNKEYHSETTGPNPDFMLGSCLLCPFAVPFLYATTCP